MIQIAETYTLPAPLPLEEGGLLVNAQVAYCTYGELSGDNGIVLLHDLTDSHRALGEPETSPFKPSGWGHTLVNEGCAFSHESHYVVCPNLLGSPFGSTSALTLDPQAARPFGPRFPAITIEDMARTVGALLRGLMVMRVRLLVGVGLGGMVALRMASLFPHLSGGVVAIGAAKSLPDGVREQLSLVRQLLEADPGYRGGDYERGHGPRRAMKKLRLDMLRRLYSRDHLVRTYGDHFAAERQLEAAAESFAEAFDANCYAHLCAAYAACDLSEALPKIAARVLLVAESTDAVAPPSRVRDTYHLLTASGVNTRYYELQSDGGHGTLTAERARLHGALTEFLATV